MPVDTEKNRNRSFFPMPTDLPARFSDDGRTATWNPALTRSPHVLLEVRTAGGEIVTRTTMNSGRARVRDTERIQRILHEG